MHGGAPVFACENEIERRKGTPQLGQQVGFSLKPDEDSEVGVEIE